MINSPPYCSHYGNGIYNKVEPQAHKTAEQMTAEDKEVIGLRRKGYSIRDVAKQSCKYGAANEAITTWAITAINLTLRSFQSKGFVIVV